MRHDPPASGAPGPAPPSTREKARLEARTRWWVIGKYALFQVPELLVVLVLAWYAHSKLGLETWIAAAAVLLWIAKDAALFPFLRRAYEPRSGGGAAALVGARGRVEETLAPAGWVRIGSELWRAELPEDSAPLSTGSHVRVRAVHGLTLLVEEEERSVHGPR